MKTDLLGLAEAQSDDLEMVPEILPVDARLAVSGKVATFLGLFERAAAVTPGKEIISGTGHALIEAFPGTSTTVPYVKVSATDGDMTVVLWADGLQVSMPGAALVPPKKILDILKIAPTENLRFEVLGNTATMRSGRAQWSVQTPIGEHLPPAPDVSTMQTVQVPVQSFLDALRAARAAASTSSARASLMQIQVRDGSLTGLDGGRLHRQRVEGLSIGLNTTIPLRVADEVARLLRGAESETFEFGSSFSHLLFRVDNDEIIAQRLLSDFPNIENQILGPALTNTHTMSVNRAILADAVKRVRVNSDPEYHAMYLTLAPGKATSDGTTWTLTVSARDRSGNEAREGMDVAWTGPKGSRSLCVNHKNLSEMLSTMTTENVAFKVGDDTKAQRFPLFVENDINGFTGWVQQTRPGYLT